MTPTRGFFDVVMRRGTEKAVLDAPPAFLARLACLVPSGRSVWEEGRRRIVSDRPPRPWWLGRTVQTLREQEVGIGERAGQIIEEGDRLTLLSRATTPHLDEARNRSWDTNPSFWDRVDDYQKVVVQFLLLAGGRILIADDTGLGKTVEGMACLESLEVYPAIVLAPPFLLENWRRHFASWLPHRLVQVLRGADPLETGRDVYVMGYSMVFSRLGDLLMVPAKGLILDEAHYVKSSDAQRSMAASVIALRTPCCIAMTATPLYNRPRDLFNILSFLDHEAFHDFNEFGEFFCDRKMAWGRHGCYVDVSGSSHTKLLGRILRERYMIRREKKDVLTSLPPVRRVLVPLDLPDDQRDSVAEAEREVRDQIRALVEQAGRMGGAKGADLASAAMNREQAMGLLVSGLMRRIAARNKMHEVLEWLRLFVEDTSRQIVVFGCHREPLLYVATAFLAPLITGETPMRDRQAAVDAFQAGRERMLVCSMLAGGVGIDLTAASDCAFVELPWNATDVYQAGSRLHRRGQQNAVTEWYLMSPDTAEERLAKLILSKLATLSDVIEDGSAGMTANVLEEFVKEFTV